MKRSQTVSDTNHEYEPKLVAGDSVTTLLNGRDFSKR